MIGEADYVYGNSNENNGNQIKKLNQYKYYPNK